MEDFIRKKIREDVERCGMSIHTRFPPEPNGYLHIGHAKAIILNFEIAREFHGLCNVRFDDTNPEKERVEYVHAIQNDIRALGYEWNDNEYYASQYFDKFYAYAKQLIEKGLAYVDNSSFEEIRSLRGTPTMPGTDSPYRTRSVEENLKLFGEMKEGVHEQGSCVLRAKIDMKHPNIIMRDPTIYRIRMQQHHKTGDAWCIYPMYDFAHCLSDAIEGITHSLCTLEFEIHRPLYDWFLDALEIASPRPQQIEFARLNITHTVLSKRVLKTLVERKVVDGWDDPRMPTLSGMRRRGYTAPAIKAFCQSVGITKAQATVEVERLEEAVRQNLNVQATRAMVVIDPIKLVITNYPEEASEVFQAENNPEQAESGTHELAFSRTLYIERDDFMEQPSKKYFRLAVGQEVRLKYAYYVTCTGFVKNDDGSIREVHAEYDPASRGGWSDDGRKVRGTIHWVSLHDARDIVIHQYERLFLAPHPDEFVDDEKAMLESVNPRSFSCVEGAKAEPYVHACLHAHNEEDEVLCMQFLRKGYFAYDKAASKARQHPVFNSTVALKQTWK